MFGMNGLIIATVLFVLSHLILSLPAVRNSLIRSLDEKGFMGFYSLVAIGLVAWIVFAYRAAPNDQILWQMPRWYAGVHTLFMFLVCLLMVSGAVAKNPTAMNKEGALTDGTEVTASIDIPVSTRSIVTQHPVRLSYKLEIYWKAIYEDSYARTVLQFYLVLDRSGDVKIRTRTIEIDWEASI